MRRNILPIVAAVSLLATPSWAQNSDSIAAANPTATYQFLKQAMIKAGGPPGMDLKTSFSVATITDCDDATVLIGYDGSETSIIRRAAELAYDVLYMQAQIKHAGYPSSLWQPEIEAYEQQHLRNIRTFRLQHLAETASADKQALAAKLNNYRKQHPELRLRRIMAGAGGCGDGEVGVRLVTTPQAQRVEYINAIKYNLCASQGLDPKAAACTHWVDYPGGSDGANMSGRYVVRVTWSDGTTTYRNLPVDSLIEDKNGGYTFAIRK